MPSEMLNAGVVAKGNERLTRRIFRALTRMSDGNILSYNHVPNAELTRQVNIDQKSQDPGRFSHYDLLIIHSMAITTEMLRDISPSVSLLIIIYLLGADEQVGSNTMSGDLLTLMNSENAPEIIEMSDRGKEIERDLERTIIDHFYKNSQSS